MILPPDFKLSKYWPAALEERLQIDSRPAVYMLMHPNEFGRLNGQSAILYIGATGELGGASQKCRLRIYKYPNGPHALELRLRTQIYIDAEIKITLHWKYCATRMDALAEESSLLKQYREEHYEHPPFNNRR